MPDAGSWLLACSAESHQSGASKNCFFQAATSEPMPAVKIETTRSCDFVFPPDQDDLDDDIHP